MKKIILFSLIILFFSGCYSKKYFEEIKYSFENVKFINILPLQYKDWFLKRDIDIDDYCLPDDKIKNIDLISWKYRWGIWISNHKNDSKADVIWNLTKMLENKGFDKILVLYNKNSKDSTIDLKLVNGNGMFTKIVKMGRFFLYDFNIFLVLLFWIITFIITFTILDHIDIDFMNWKIILIHIILFILTLTVLIIISAYIIYFYWDILIIIFLILGIIENISRGGGDTTDFIIIPVKRY
jgi:hypothetical protein